MTPNGFLRFQQSSPDPSFAVDSHTGCVVLKQPLDREAAARVTLTLAARDPGGRGDSAQLAVGVQDCNDNTPTFPGAAVTAAVAEGRAYIVPPLQVVVGCGGRKGG